MEELEDKKLYSYKQALSQPYWIQKINDDFSLQSPVKFSRIVYMVVIFTLLFYTSEICLHFLPTGLRVTIASVIAIFLSETLSNLVVDGKALIFYVHDYLKYYFTYGNRHKDIYLNKGLIYHKPRPLYQGKESHELPK